MAQPAELPVDPAAARFSVWHALAIFIAGVIGGIVGFSIGVGITGDEVDTFSDQSALTTFCGFAGQFGVIAAGLVLVSRWRATGSWRRDYGLVVRINDGWAIFAGLGLQVALLIALFPLVNLVDDEQGVVEDIQDANGAKLAVLAIFAGVVAPLLEEVLFRGLFLRALLRKMKVPLAIAIDAIVFGGIHALLDPSLGTLVITPGLIIMGAFAAVMAVRSGELSQPILFHVGFNMLVVVGALFG
jgi:membrane protease YdiL (CAAX protease family)